MDYKHWLSRNFDKSADWVFITGASSGIGLSFLKFLAAEKCNCLILSNEGPELEKIASDIANKYQIKVVPLVCDLAKIDQVLALKDQLMGYRIKFLINNAAFGYKGDFLDCSAESIVDMVTVNSTAYTVIIHMALPQMREMNCGAVISVSSLNIATPIPKSAVYTATKFYGWAMSLAVAFENAKYNIVFQALLPGTTLTPFHTKQGSQPRWLTMTADEVAKRSLNRLYKKIYLPNRVDRVAFQVFTRLPWFLRMKLVTHIMKARLNV